MSEIHNIRAKTERHATIDEPPSVATSPEEEAYARAEQRMQRGKRLVISGFIVAVLGIVTYCVASFSAGVNMELGAAFLENPWQLVGLPLGMIALGTLLWLVGSFVYLDAAMDSDPNGPDPQF